MTVRQETYTIIPYRKQREIDYASAYPEVFKPVKKPDVMEQGPYQDEIMGVLRKHLADFNRRPDVFVERDTNICYDPGDLNVRIAPDVYAVFGVEAHAIRPNQIYLPWEVGKPPDWVLEVGSSSTGREDVRDKPAIYARIGVPEYWLFDHTGGRYHGEPLMGLLLSGSEYRPVELTTEPDGVLKGYSPVLQLFLAWDNGWPRFYNPATGTYLSNWPEDQDALHNAQAARRRAEAERQRAEAERQRAEAERNVERAARQVAEIELEQLREQIRRQQPPESL